MISHYAKIVQSLAAATPDDRRWLLSQLSENDRIRVLECLRDISSSSGATETGRVNGSSIPAANESANESDRDYKTINDASPELVRELLGFEPYWIVASILTMKEWRWADAFLESCSPHYVERVTRVVRAKTTAVKPRFRQTVLSLLAQRIQAHSIPAVAPHPFERMLSRAERRLSRELGEVGTEGV